MGKAHAPRHGSMMVSPRVRAKRIYPRVSSKKITLDAVPVEFAGYKVGMTNAKIIDDVSDSATHNQEIIVPVTVIETPPFKVLGIRAYKKEPYGLKVSIDVLAEKIDDNASKKITVPKKKRNITKELESFEKDLESYEKIVLVVHTQPSMAGIHKTKPEVFEISVGGKIADAFSYAKEKLGLDLPVDDVLKAGAFVDTIAITKGHGFQGSIKRFGVHLLPKKSQKLRRKAANLGGFHPHKVKRTVPQMGQTGYHKRTDYNKRIISISNDKDQINADGWHSYGLVKSSYVLLAGSVPGSRKRLIRIRNAVRDSKGKLKEPQVVSVYAK